MTALRFTPERFSFGQSIRGGGEPVAARLDPELQVSFCATNVQKEREPSTHREFFRIDRRRRRPLRHLVSGCRKQATAALRRRAGSSDAAGAKIDLCGGGMTHSVHHRREGI